MRVAFFGGTFDPIHRGHLRIAAAAADAFALDQVLFAPVGDQPLKSESVASFADRLAIVRLAIADNPPDHRFAASTLDAPRPDHTSNYTIDTLGRLTAEYPGAELFVIVGADSFLQLRQWRSPDSLLAAAQWIVVSRPDFPLTEADIANIAPAPYQRARIHLLANIHEDISATTLRHRIKLGQPCENQLPPRVEAYIQSHQLYR